MTEEQERIILENIDDLEDLFDLFNEKILVRNTKNDHNLLSFSGESLRIVNCLKSLHKLVEIKNKIDNENRTNKDN